MDMRKETSKALETVQAQVDEMKQTEQVIMESMGDGDKQPQKKEGSFDIKIPENVYKTHQIFRFLFEKSSLMVYLFIYFILFFSNIALLKY